MESAKAWQGYRSGDKIRDHCWIDSNVFQAVAINRSYLSANELEGFVKEAEVAVMCCSFVHFFANADGTFDWVIKDYDFIITKNSALFVSSFVSAFFFHCYKLLFIINLKDRFFW